MKKAATKKKAIETPAAETPKPLPKVQKELHESVASALARFMSDLAAERAGVVARHMQQEPADKRPCITLYPFGAKSEALALGFALEVGSIERGACMNLIEQIVDAETAERIASAIAQRGPLQETLTAQFSYVFDEGKREWKAKWSEHVTEIALAK